VLSDKPKELKVKNVESCLVVLADFNLGQKGLTQNVYRDIGVLLEQFYEASEHHFSDVDFPVKLNQQESEGLVDVWCESVPLSSESVQDSEQKLDRDYDQRAFHVSGSSLQRSSYLLGSVDQRPLNKFGFRPPYLHHED